MSKLIGNIPQEKQEKRGWTVKVNGIVIEELLPKSMGVEHLGIFNPRFGELAYGLTPGGWDGLGFHELGGGGSVIAPFVEKDGVLHIGMVKQNRPFQGGVVLNVPRGFLNPGEAHFQAAKRELEEETGYRPANDRVFLLVGDPANPNSAFFDTSEPGEGVKFFAFEVLSSEVEPDPDNKALLRFKAGVLEPASKAAKDANILGCSFHPWEEAVAVSDMFTNTATARLLGHLKRQGKK